jgi:hypothetical protein
MDGSLPESSEGARDGRHAGGPEPPAVRPVDDFVMYNVSPKSKRYGCKLPTYSKFECRRCEIEKISSVTERRLEDGVLGYSGCYAQSSPNLVERFHYYH